MKICKGVAEAPHIPPTKKQWKKLGPYYDQFTLECCWCQEVFMHRRPGVRFVSVHVRWFRCEPVSKLSWIIKCMN